AQWITPGEAVNPHYWAKHVRQTVRFAEGVGELLKNPETVLLEAGPGRTLSTFANQHPAKTAGQTVLLSFLPGKDQEISAMLTALGKLWLAGKPVDWAGFYAHEKRRRVALPGYPFERKRFWIEPVAKPQAGTLPAAEPRSIASSLPAQEADAPATRADDGSRAPSAATSRKDHLLALLRIQFHELSGADLKDPSVSFMELGLDSLLLSQASQSLEKKFGVKIAFRQMLENLSTINDLADHLDRQLPPGAFAADSAPASSVAAPAASSATLEDIQAQLAALTRELETLRRTKTESPTQTSPDRDDEEEAVTLPLTEPQKELWLASQAGENASRAFNQVFAVHLSDRIKAE
ncbi:MAG: phosphopantetheine-binding protein, partial [Bryobacteraceae bacterium]